MIKVGSFKKFVSFFLMFPLLFSNVFPAASTFAVETYSEPLENRIEPNIVDVIDDTEDEDISIVSSNSSEETKLPSSPEDVMDEEVTSEEGEIITSEESFQLISEKEPVQDSGTYLKNEDTASSTSKPVGHLVLTIKIKGHDKPEDLSGIVFKIKNADTGELTGVYSFSDMNKHACQDKTSEENSQEVSENTTESIDDNSDESIIGDQNDSQGIFSEDTTPTINLIESTSVGSIYFTIQVNGKPIEADLSKTVIRVKSETSGDVVASFSFSEMEKHADTYYKTIEGLEVGN